MLPTVRGSTWYSLFPVCILYPTRNHNFHGQDYCYRYSCKNHWKKKCIFSNTTTKQHQEEVCVGRIAIACEHDACISVESRIIISFSCNWIFGCIFICWTWQVNPLIWWVTMHTVVSKSNPGGDRLLFFAHCSPKVKTQRRQKCNIKM